MKRIVLILFLLLFSCRNDEPNQGTIPEPPAAPPVEQIMLAWDAPTAYATGDLLPAWEPTGYRIYYGTSSGNYLTSIDVGNVTTYTMNDLASGTYYFAVTAYTEYGNESDYSNEVMKVIKE